MRTGVRPGTFARDAGYAALPQGERITSGHGNQGLVALERFPAPPVPAAGPGLRLRRFRRRVVEHLAQLGEEVVGLEWLLDEAHPGPEQ